MADIELYFSPQPTRSARARWAFLEAGMHFDPHRVDVFKGEQRAPAYLAVNPLGKVPSANLGGQSLIESSALAWIAANENPKANLVADRGTPAWREAVQWMVFAPAELDHYLVTLNEERMLLPPKQRSKERFERTVSLLAERAGLVANALGAKTFLLGDGFSVADICVGHALAWAKMHDQLLGHPTLQKYLERLQERKAFQEVYGPTVEVMADPHAGEG